MAKEDNWLMLAVGGAILAIVAFFGLGKTVQIQAGQAKSDCGCGR